MVETTKSDFLREWINKALDEKYDFSTISNRRKNLDSFVETYKSKFKDLDRAKVKSLYNKLLKECLKKKGVDPRAYGLEKKIPKFHQPSSTMDANITPKPQDVAQKKPDETAQAPNMKGAVTADGKPTITSQIITQAEAPTVFEPKDVSACFAGVWMGIKHLVPELEDLTDKEKETLGNLWVRAFNKYLSDKWLIIVIPCITTLGLLAPKISKARKLKKINKDSDTSTKKKELKEEKQQGTKQDKTSKEWQGDESWSE